MLNISSLVTPCLTNGYFSGQYFNYKIILEFLNDYCKGKIPHKLPFCNHIKDKSIIFLLWCVFLSKRRYFYTKTTICLIMPQTAKYFAKIFCMRNISQNTVRLFKQLTTFFKSIFLKYQSGFWKDPRNTVYSCYDWKVESISRNARFMWSLINKFVKSICLTATLPFDSKTSLFWIWENLYIKSKTT